jgi:hypothetical protein
MMLPSAVAPVIMSVRAVVTVPPGVIDTKYGFVTSAAWLARIFALRTDCERVALVRVWMDGWIGVAAAALNLRN